jgi:hypothetical protein
MGLGCLPAKGASRNFLIEKPVWLLYLMANDLLGHCSCFTAIRMSFY